MASMSVAVATGTSDVQGFTGAGQLVGYSVRETVGSDSATITLRDGTTTGGAVIASDTVAGGTARAVLLPSVPFSTGIFIDRSGSGSSEVVLYLA